MPYKVEKYAHLLPEDGYAWAREKLTPKFSKRMCLLQGRWGILPLARVVWILLKPKERKKKRDLNGFQYTSHSSVTVLH